MCEHQPLPMMEGLPMQLMIDPEATPVAHHKPLPVPLHWWEGMKAGLDQHVCLGVIEPVPMSSQLFRQQRVPLLQPLKPQSTTT